MLTDGAGSDASRRSEPRSVTPADAYSGRAIMAMDVYQAGHYSCVEIDVPGVDAAAIEIDLHDGLLTVRARRVRQHFGPDDVEVGEREYGTFSRELYVPETLDVHELEVEYGQGVLKISVPSASRPPSHDWMPAAQRPAVD